MSNAVGSDDRDEGGAIRRCGSCSEDLHEAARGSTRLLGLYTDDDDAARPHQCHDETRLSSVDIDRRHTVQDDTPSDDQETDDFEGYSLNV